MKSPFPLSRSRHTARLGRGSPFILKIWRCLNLVHPYQVVIYLGLFSWGIYGAFSATPTLLKPMPDTIYTIWISIHIIAPMVVWIGQLIHQWEPTPKKILLGWELQWAGDAAIFFDMATIALTFALAPEPKFLYLIAIFISWSVPAFMLAGRDLVAIGYYWGICHEKCDDDDD